MSSLYQIVYVSSATVPFTKGELVELLKGSVQRNLQAGITGLLAYQDGVIMQVLEGDKAAVSGLYDRICRDPRHHNIIPLLREPIEQRDFPDSAMAFRDLNTPALRDLPGYSEFLNTPLNGDLMARDIPKCKRLLLVFKQNMR